MLPNYGHLMIFLPDSWAVSAYAIGIAGWATGLKLGSESKGIQWTAHWNIGISLFSLATLQMDREHSGENCLEDNVDDASDDMSISNTNDGLEFENMWKHVMDTWQRQQVEAIVQLLCYIVNLLWLLNIQAMIIGKPLSSINAERDALRHKLMCELTANEVICRDILCMGPVAFAEFCGKLRATGLLKDFRCATVEEQVAKFLQILGQNFRNRALGFFFHRSGETISRHFHNVLRAVVALEAEFLNQPTGADVHPQILNNNRFYPYFKISRRKEWPMQNVLAACSFDMKFTYVLPGWEGTASDSRILKNALDREDKLLIPQGKFYLVDAGLPLRSGLIAPYRGVRYHLNEYSRRGPQNAKELFNHRYASLRNVIERAFGVLKKRFQIIASGTEPHYSFETMIEIVLACCIIHNFLMGVDPDENLIAEVDRELMHAEADHHVGTSGLATDADYRIGVMLREQIASQMWNDYYNNLKNRKHASGCKHQFNYDKLYELYGNQRATGEYAESAREKVRRWQREGSSSQIDLNDTFENVIMSDSEFNWVNEVTDNNMNSPEPSLHSQGTSSRCSKCKVSMMEILEKQYERLNSGIERVSEVLKRGNAIAEKSLAILESGRPHYYKEEELFTELELIGVHPDFVMTAYCYLSKNPSATRSFFGVP
ncbi:hypothetical protein GH714_042312 [Hevea brasiliensis]|uniref:Uncharacterized protein n=1 Tax=Hevea brasiliensis TaxID=3981 RepID=A0A6A6KSI8_HEVBR|nr:hypothetical protein GH714_042312 [Hevea brasiliensis]